MICSHATTNAPRSLHYFNGCSVRSCAKMMVPNQGLAAADAQLLSFSAAKHNLPLARKASVRSPAAFLNLRSPTLRHGKKISLQAAASGSSTWDYSTKAIPFAATQRNLRPRTHVSPGASLSPHFSYPEQTSRPEWWWRTLACVPYLVPLHGIWGCADAVYRLHPYLRGWLFMYRFVDTWACLGGSAPMVISLAAYHFVVRRRGWPHFVRFHVMLAILLDVGSSAVAAACGWLPSMAFEEKPMACLWMGVAFIEMYTVVHCMLCALAGKYASVPFVCDTAFIHSDLNLLR